MIQPHKPEPFPPDTTPKGALFDPKLKEVMKEIRVILDAHKVAAYVAIQSPHYAEYLIEFPSWGCVSLADGQIRIYSKRTDFPSLEAQKACLEASAGMILQLDTMLSTHAELFAEIGRRLGEHIDIAHGSQHTPGE
jgi:hypothetical protein